VGPVEKVRIAFFVWQLTISPNIVPAEVREF
jgi:hypothetical protein